MARNNTIQLLRGDMSASPSTELNYEAGEPVIDTQGSTTGDTWALHIGEGTSPASTDKFFIGGGAGGTWSSATASKPEFILKNTTNDANSSVLKFTKDKGAAGAAGDDIGIIEFIADNAAEQQTSYAKILAEIGTGGHTDGDEAGKLSFFVAESSGTASQLTAGLVLQGEEGTDGEVDVTIGAASTSMTTIAGDLTITGDDLYMNTNTDKYLLVADGTNFNPVESTGDVIIANTGAATIQAGAVETAMIADNQVTLAKMAGLDRGHIIYGDSSGDPASLANSTTQGQVLTVSNANGDIGWATPTSGDIEGVTAGTNLNGGGTSGTVTLNLDTEPTFSSSTTLKPVITVTNTTADATSGELRFKNTNGAAAGDDGDVLGYISGYANNDASPVVEHEFANIKLIAADTDNSNSGDETGKISFSVSNTNGSNAAAMGEVMTITGGAAVASSTVAALGNLTVAGDLTVTGTTITDNVEVISTSSGVVFEGGTDDGHEATMVSAVASSDKTYTLPNVTGYVGLFAADPSTTTISSTPAELNILDGVTATFTELNYLDITTLGTAAASKALTIKGDSTWTVAGMTCADLGIATTIDINGGTIDGATIGASSATTIVGTTITANTGFVPDASDGAYLGTSSAQFSDLFLADAAVINLGDDQDVTLTHYADNGILLNTTRKIYFEDGTNYDQYIGSAGSGVTAIAAPTEIDLTATTIDINGNADVSGTLTVGTFSPSNLTATGNVDIEGYAAIGNGSTLNADIGLIIDYDTTFASEADATHSQLKIMGTVVSNGSSTAAENNMSGLIVAPQSMTVAASKTATWVTSARFDEPNITEASGASATNAATVYISGAATEATNNYALYCNGAIGGATISGGTF